MGLLDRLRQRRTTPVGSSIGSAGAEYKGPNQLVVVSFIDSLANLSKADWYSVVDAVQREPEDEAFDIAVRAAESAGRDHSWNVAALLGERHVTSADAVWADSWAAATARAEAAAMGAGRAATFGDVQDAGGGEVLRLAGHAVTGATGALVLFDLLPIATLELLLKPFRHTHASLPTH